MSGLTPDVVEFRESIFDRVVDELVRRTPDAVINDISIIVGMILASAVRTDALKHSDLPKIVDAIRDDIYQATLDVIFASGTRKKD